MAGEGSHPSQEREGRGLPPHQPSPTPLPTHTHAHTRSCPSRPSLPAAGELRFWGRWLPCGKRRGCNAVAAERARGCRPLWKQRGSEPVAPRRCGGLPGRERVDHAARASGVAAADTVPFAFEQRGGGGAGELRPDAIAVWRHATRFGPRWRAKQRKGTSHAPSQKTLYLYRRRRGGGERRERRPAASRESRCARSRARFPPIIK